MSEQNSIVAVEKAISVLEVFLVNSGKPLKVAAICEMTGYKRNSVDRILAVWEKREYLTRNQRNEWTLGKMLLRFSESYAEFCLQAISTQK